MLSEAEFDAVIGAIYEAGADFSRWPATLLRLAACFGAHSAVMGRQGKTASECWAFAPALDPKALESYADYYHRINPVWQRVPSTPAGTVQTDSMVLPRRELVRTEFYNDFLRPLRMEALLNAVALVEDGRQTVITVQSPRPFEPEHVALYQRLAPHLQRAIQLNIKLARLGTAEGVYAEALDRLEGGVLLVDADARVVFANRAAEGLFARANGLRQREGRLCAGLPAETADLHALIGGCADRRPRQAQGGFLPLSRGDGRMALCLFVAPLRSAGPPWLDAERAVAIVLVRDPDQCVRPAAAQLRVQFGLTQSEAEFAREMLQGDGLQAAADRLTITLATARTHLARVFAKTGTRRQAELVRLLLSITPG